jgi:tRNA (mo5U34)-methyltransferase
MTLQSHGHAVTDDDVVALAPWFHNLHLPDGTETAPDHPLGDFPAFKWAELGPALPADLSGCRALDIGCNAGFYSVELARRGASVLGVDHDPHYLRQAEWVRHRFGFEDRIELRRLGVYELDQLDEQFDLVLFMGVLYHLRHPLLGIDLVADRVRGTLVVQTLTVDTPPSPGTPADVPYEDRDALRDPAWPSMAFVEHSLAGDPTNWWVPSGSAVEAMLRSAGLRVVDHPLHETWICDRAEGRH